MGNNLSLTLYRKDPPMTAKVRTYTTGSSKLKLLDLYQGKSVLVRQSTNMFKTYGIEELVSDGHPWPPKKGSVGNVGGNFSVRRAVWNHSPAYGYVPLPGGSNVKSAGFWGMVPTQTSSAKLGPSSLPSLIPETTMLAMGTKGWAQYKPTRSQGGLDQALGEAHQIPSVTKIKSLQDAFKRARREHGWHLPFNWRSRTLLKSVSDNYLNYVFGWVPLINDLTDLAANSLLLEKRLRQLHRDNGKAVRRKGPVGGTTTSTQVSNSHTESGGFCFPAVVEGPFDPKTQDLAYTKTTQTSFQFSGRFRYYLQFPTRKLGFLEVGSREDYQLARILFGGEITPQTLYEIMPWSWLIDWVAPLGDLIGNVVNDPIDNLTADYAFITGLQTTTESWVVRGRGKEIQPYVTSATLEKKVLQRRGASPYGFGLLWSDFSLKQLSILAALGYQKLG